MEHQITNSEIRKALHHVEVLNKETGELRDAQHNFNGKIEDLTREFLDFKSNICVEMGEMKTDLAWLKKFFWVVITASVGSAVAAVAGLVINH